MLIKCNFNDHQSWKALWNIPTERPDGEADDQETFCFILFIGRVIAGGKNEKIPVLGK